MHQEQHCVLPVLMLSHLMIPQRTYPTPRSQSVLPLHSRTTATAVVSPTKPARSQAQGVGVVGRLARVDGRSKCHKVDQVAIRGVCVLLHEGRNLLGAQAHRHLAVQHLQSPASHTQAAAELGTGR